MAETPLQEQVAVVTGAGQGIGRAVARRLAQLGAQVVLASRKSAPLEELAAEIRQAGGVARVQPTDVRMADDVDALVRASLEAAGHIDIWVNNAGVGFFGAPLHETPPDVWAATMETNLRSAYYSIRALAPHLIQRRCGHIINIASLAAYNPVPGRTAYAVSKAGLRALTISAAEELRPYGVRVSVISPGSVDTDFSPRLTSGKNRSRMLQPDDIAHAVAMLVTQAPQSFVSEIFLRPTMKP